MRTFLIFGLSGVAPSLSGSSRLAMSGQVGPRERFAERGNAAHTCQGARPHWERSMFIFFWNGSPYWSLAMLAVGRCRPGPTLTN